MGQVWRHVRTDRSIVNNKLDRGTVRRVLSFARPHRRLIAVFLVLTVVDACLVVVTPLLVQRIVDDGILAKDTALVFEAGRPDGADRSVRGGPGSVRGVAVLADR